LTVDGLRFTGTAPAAETRLRQGYEGQAAGVPAEPAFAQPSRPLTMAERAVRAKAAKGDQFPTVAYEQVGEQVHYRETTGAPVKEATPQEFAALRQGWMAEGRTVAQQRGLAGQAPAVPGEIRGKARIEAARARLKARAETKQGQAGFAGLGPRRAGAFRRVQEDPGLLADLGDWAEIGLGHLEEGVHDFAEWSKRLIADIGNEIKPYLSRVYHDSVRRWQRGDIEPAAAQARAAEILKGRKAGEGIQPGMIVHAADRANFGTVQSVSGAEAMVHFVSPEGTEATVSLPVSALTNAEGTMQEAFGALRAERGEQGYRMTLGVGDEASSGDEAVQAVAEEIASPRRAEQLSEPAQELLSWWDKTKALLFHRDVALEKGRAMLAEALGEKGLLGTAADPATTMALATTRAGGRFEQAIHRGWFNDAGEKVAPALEQVIRTAESGGRSQEEFEIYAAMLHARDLAKAGRQLPENWTPSAIEQVIAHLDSPEFRQAAADLQRYNDQLRRVLEEGGFQGAGWAEAMAAKYPNYVPLVRVVMRSGAPAQGGPDVTVPQLVQALKGGRLIVKSPLAEIQRRTRLYLDLAEMWKARGQTADMADRAGPEMAWMMHKIEPATERERVSHEAAKDFIQELFKGMADADGTAVGVTPEAVAKLLEGRGILRETVSGDAGADVLPVLRGGKLEFYQVHPDLMPVFTARNSRMAELLSSIPGGRLLTTIKNAQRAMYTTFSWKFSLRNISRDTVGAYMQSEGYRPLLGDMVGALFDIIRKPKEYEAWVRAGGMQTGGEALTMEPGALAEAWATAAKRLGKPAGAAEAAARAALWLPQTIGKVGDVIETIPRRAVARRAMRRGLARGLPYETALVRSAVAGREATVPFERGGTFTKDYNRLVAFFNAGFQGPYTAGRWFNAHRQETLVKGLVSMTLPTIAYYHMVQSNPQWRKDWENLPGYRKYAGWNVPIGTDQKGETKFLFVPMPWEWGLVFAAAPMAAIEQFKGRDPEAWKEWIESGATTVSPLGQGTEIKGATGAAGVVESVGMAAGASMVPSAAQPWTDIWANRRWTGAPIIPRRLEEASPKVQYDERTSELARAVGSKIGYAPLKIDYLIGSYLGTVGMDISAGIDAAAAKLGIGAKPQGPSDQPGLLRGIVEKASQYSDLTEDFYNDQARLKRIESEGEEKMTDAEVDRLADAGDVARDLSDIRTEKREVMASGDTPEEKRQRIDALAAEETRTLAGFLGRPVPEWARGN